MRDSDRFLNEKPGSPQGNQLATAIMSLEVTAAIVMAVTAAVIMLLHTKTQIMLAVSMMSLILLGAVARFLAEVIMILWDMAKQAGESGAKLVFHGIMMMAAAAAILVMTTNFILKTGNGMVVLSPAQLTQLLARLSAGM